MTAAERMIPILPCRSIDDQLAFYEALGFEVTCRQKAPNVYAAVARGGIELHFFVMKGYDPAGSYGELLRVRDRDRSAVRVVPRRSQGLARPHPDPPRRSWPPP